MIFYSPNDGSKQQEKKDEKILTITHISNLLYNIRHIITTHTEKNKCKLHLEEVGDGSWNIGTLDVHCSGILRQ